MNLRTLFCLVCCLLPAIAVARGDAITIGERLSLHSDLLDEERAYWVHLPASYERGSREYPVMYLLDGNAHFHSATGVVDFMSGGGLGNMQIPEMIVVAIPNTDRTRDLTPTHTRIGFDGKEQEFLANSGGGDTFLQFLREELIPHINASFRTMPYRVLVGHSFGGLLAVHAFLNHNDLFEAYVAIDPSMWWDEQKLLRSAAERMEATASDGRSIYITLANNPVSEPGQAKPMELAGRELAMILESADAPDVRSAMRYFGDEDHGSVPLVSLYHGLLFTFDGFKPDTEAFIEDPGAVAEHFKRVSAQFDLEFLPPEEMVNELGYYLLSLDEVAKATTLFQLNVDNYPNSGNVYDSLAEAYMIDGQSALAVAFYRKSLEVDPDNDNARQKLTELGEPH